MSFRSLLERSVTWTPRTVTSQDAHGNDVLADGTPVAGIPAARDPVELDESSETSSVVADRWLYLLPASHDGTLIRPGPHDRITDGDEELEIGGTPDLVYRRRNGRVHHVELIAYRVS